MLPEFSLATLMYGIESLLFCEWASKKRRQHELPMSAPPATNSPWCKSYCAQSSTWNQQVAARFCRVSDLHHGLLGLQVHAHVLYCQKPGLLFLWLIAPVALLVASLVSFIVFVFSKVVLPEVVPV